MSIDSPVALRRQARRRILDAIEDAQVENAVEELVEPTERKAARRPGGETLGETIRAAKAQRIKAAERFRGPYAYGNPKRMAELQQARRRVAQQQRKAQ